MKEMIEEKLPAEAPQEEMGEEYEMSDAQESQLEAYKDNATLVIFSKKSQPAILQELQADKNPVKAIALTANDINRQLETSLEAEGEPLTEVTLCFGAAHLVKELCVLAEAAKLFTLPVEDRLEAFRQTAMKYFQDGLVDGSIDPVELQKMIEPIMTDEQRAFGQQQADASGILKTAPPSGMARPAKQQAQPQPASVLEGGSGNGF
jgi:hypothetical protein